MKKSCINRVILTRFWTRFIPQFFGLGVYRLSIHCTPASHRFSIRVPAKCETKQKTKRNETKQIEMKRNETDRNETKRNKSKRNETKRSAIFNEAGSK